MAHYAGKELADGVATPFFVEIDGEYKKVGEGKFDKKNSFIEVEVDTETEEGKLLLSNIYKNNIRSMTHEQNYGENHD